MVDWLSNNQFFSNNNLVFNTEINPIFNFFTEVNLDLDVAAEFNFDSLISIGDISPSGAAQLSFAALGLAGSILKSIEDKKRFDFIVEQFEVINKKLDFIIEQLDDIQDDLDNMNAKLDVLTERVEGLGLDIQLVPFRDRIIELQGDLYSFSNNIERWSNEPDQYATDISRLRLSMRDNFDDLIGGNAPIGLHTMGFALPAFIALVEISNDLPAGEKDHQKTSILEEIEGHLEKQLSEPQVGDRTVIDNSDSLSEKIAVYTNKIGSILPLKGNLPTQQPIGAPKGSLWDIKLRPNEYVCELNIDKAYPLKAFMSAVLVPDYKFWFGGMFRHRGKPYYLDGALRVMGVYIHNRSHRVFQRKGLFVYPSDETVAKVTLPYGSLPGKEVNNELLDIDRHLPSWQNWTSNFVPIVGPAARKSANSGIRLTKSSAVVKGNEHKFPVPDVRMRDDRPNQLLEIESPLFNLLEAVATFRSAEIFLNRIKKLKVSTFA